VRKGDNLTLIARRLGITLSELRRDNNLKSDLIHPGQRLEIKQPLRRLGTGDIRWRCPLARPGEVVRAYGSYKNEHGVTIPHTGVDLDAAPGSRLVSPATGVVRYLGYQDGFGLLMIIEHGAKYTSVLAPLDAQAVLREVGEVVLGGTELGRLGSPTEHDRAYLHVELRRNNKAINPSRLQN
jgi:murein DD-endopeptidase MepM/ murein hydrolase activator NlpD